MGGDSGNRVPQETQASRTLSRIANQTFQETTPLRKGIISNFEQLLGMDPRLQQVQSLQDRLLQPVTTTRVVSNPNFVPNTGGLGGAQFNQAPQTIRTSRPLTDTERAPILDQIAALEADIESNPASDNLLFGIPDINDIEASPQFGLLKFITDQQFQRAEEQALENLPVGGVLDRITGFDLPRARAAQEVQNFADLGELLQQQRNILRQEAINVAQGGTVNSISAATGAGGIQATLAQAQAANAQADATRAAGNAAGAGQLVGLAISGGKTGGAGGGGKVPGGK